MSSNQHEDDFYEHLSRSAGFGRRISDPSLSPEERSLMLDRSSQWFEDCFHRRLSENHPNDSILRRSDIRSPVEAPASRMVAFLRHSRSTESLFAVGGKERFEQEETHSVGSGAQGMMVDSVVDAPRHSVKFWRLDDSIEEWIASEQKDIPGLAPTGIVLSTLETNSVKRKKSSKSLDFDHNKNGTKALKSSKRYGINFSFDRDLLWFRGRKKLSLEQMNMKACDIPVSDLVGTSLGYSLTSLSLARNPLRSVPSSLVQSLPSLKTLNLSQCSLQDDSLPSKWNLPRLTGLDLSFNHLLEFPCEEILNGVPLLQELNLYGNKITRIRIPANANLLSNLQTLDISYNDLVTLDDNIGRLPALRTLRVSNNFLFRIPSTVCCDMKTLKSIDVSCNPVEEPPIECCERGIHAMSRYWRSHSSRNKVDAAPAAAAATWRRSRFTTTPGTDKVVSCSFPPSKV